jgi:peptide/nickel transport system ATP-binding protein
VSMVDPSEQAKMIQLLKHLQVERGMSMIFISHDLAVVLRIADRVVVLERGRIVEEGSGSNLLIAPRHPMTRALLDASGRDALVRDLLSSADGNGAVTLEPTAT